MTSPPALCRITFSEVVLGQRFFDPISAEYFVKLTASMAAMVTGIGDGTVPDEFEADDVVGTDTYPRTERSTTAYRSALRKTAGGHLPIPVLLNRPETIFR